MKKKLHLMASVMLVALFTLVGCGDKKAETGGTDEAQVLDSIAEQQKADSLAALTQAQEAEASKKVLAEMFEGTLKTALETAELTEALSGGEFTVFMPTEEALEEVKDKLGDKTEAEKILKNHVVSGIIAVPDMMPDQELETLGGGKLKLTVQEGLMYVGGVEIMEEHDIEATNGIVHKINKVLIP